MLRCCVCDRDWPDDKCQQLTLTDEERAHVVATGAKVKEPFIYCNPCWRVLSDRMMGAQLMKSVFQLHLRQRGRFDAEVATQAYYDRLLGLSKGRKE